MDETFTKSKIIGKYDLILEALNKWGIGIVAVVCLVPVYNDLKASNKQYVELLERHNEITISTVRVLNAMTKQIEGQTESSKQVQEMLKRIESRHP